MKDRLRSTEENHQTARDVYDGLLRRDEEYRRQGRQGINPKQFNNALRQVIETNPNLTQGEARDMLDAMDRIEAAGEEEAAPPYVSYVPRYYDEAMELNAGVLLDHIGTGTKEEQEIKARMAFNLLNSGRDRDQS